MNKLHPKSKSSEALTRQLIKSYAYDLTIEETAARTGISRRQVTEIFGRIRQRVADHIGELMGKYQAMPEWQEVLNHKYSTAYMSLILWKSGLLTTRGGDLIIFKNLDAPEIKAALELREFSKAHPDEYEKMVWDDVNRHLDSTAIYYNQYRMRRRRGVLKKDADSFFKESCYRFMVSMIANRNKIIPEKQREINSSTGAVTFNVRIDIEETVFGWDKNSYRLISNDLINIIKLNPL